MIFSYICKYFYHIHPPLSSHSLSQTCWSPSSSQFLTLLLSCLRVCVCVPICLIIVVYMNIDDLWRPGTWASYLCLHNWRKCLPFPQQSLIANNSLGRDGASWALPPSMMECWCAQSCWSIAGNHSYCEFMSTVIMLCQKDSILQHSSPSSSSYILFTLSYTTFPEPWRWWYRFPT